MADKLLLITGATGKQGGAAIRALADKGFQLRALTRRPDSLAGQALAAAGVEVARGDLDDETSLRQALEGAWGAFSVQNTWEAGVKHEEEQGKIFARLARESGVQHFVYTSVGSAHRHTGIPHFDNKARIEQVVRELDFPSYTILRPVFFMENLTSPWFLNGDKLTSALGARTVLQMIATEDIGKYVAYAFVHATKVSRREIDLAGDATTMPDAAALLGEALHHKIAYVQIPISEVRKSSEDFALMLDWFNKVGYSVDIGGLQREFGIRPTSVREWIAKNVRA